MTAVLFGNFLVNYLIIINYIINFLVGGNFVPPGTTKLRGVDFYVDEVEVTNQDWAGYLHYIKNKYGKNSIEYKPALPDSTVWHSVYSGNVLSWRGKYALYPVVGISFRQAKAYCEWRSQLVNIKYKKYNTQYQLPSPEEWESIYSKLKKRSPKFSLYPYKNKKYNAIKGLIDNVSEMTCKENVAKGNNWNLLKNHILRNDTTIKYQSPQNWLGFRCIAYVKRR